jgi:hypothetical protein
MAAASFFAACERSLADTVAVKALEALFDEGTREVAVER